MAIHAQTVAILVEKAQFESKVALGVAEAIDWAMTQAQFVTVAILDARLSVLEEKFDAKLAKLEGKIDAKLAKLEGKIEATLAKMEARLIRWVFLVMLGNVALSLAATTVMNALKAP